MNGPNASLFAEVYALADDLAITVGLIVPCLIAFLKNVSDVSKLVETLKCYPIKLRTLVWPMWSKELDHSLSLAGL